MSSAVRCSCEAFYDEEVLANHFDKILPYLCFEFLVFRDMESDTADPLNRSPDLAGVDDITGNRESYTTCEKANLMVDREKTVANIARMRAAGTLAAKTSVCGTENRYTMAWFKQQVKDLDKRSLAWVMNGGQTCGSMKTTVLATRLTPARDSPWARPARKMRNAITT